jgi:hypothetical protein
MLIPVFLEPSAHVALGLMPSESSRSHVILFLRAGTTRALGITSKALMAEPSI